MRLSSWRRAITLALLLAASSVLAGFSGGLTGSAAAESGVVVMTATGDIDGCNDNGEDTAELVAKTSGPVITVGDNGYPQADADAFSRCYDPTWGALKGRTHPVPGNHEYDVSKAGPYFEYFGAAAGEPGRGWYSFQAGSWHVVALNSNCDSVDCDEQATWLERDLTDHPSACILAYWHHPRFTSGTSGGDGAVGAFWKVLYAHGASLVLNGHDHDYERFAPQDPSGRSDPKRGIREFVVGTGGAALGSLNSTAPNSEVRNNRSYGVLELTLRPDGYDWRFVPVSGDSFTDSGSDTCRGTAPAPSSPPTSIAEAPPSPPEAPATTQPLPAAPAAPAPAPKDPPVTNRRTPRSAPPSTTPRAPRPNRPAGTGATMATPAPAQPSLAPEVATPSSIVSSPPVPDPPDDTQTTTEPIPVAQPDGSDARALAMTISGLIETPAQPEPADRRGVALLALGLVAVDCAAIGTLRRRGRRVFSG